MARDLWGDLATRFIAGDDATRPRLSQATRVSINFREPVGQAPTPFLDELRREVEPPEEGWLDRRLVDLPPPDRPTNAVISPPSAENDMSRKTAFPGE